jgi:hypothetical protein
MNKCDIHLEGIDLEAHGTSAEELARLKNADLARKIEAIKATGQTVTANRKRGLEAEVKLLQRLRAMEEAGMTPAEQIKAVWVRDLKDRSGTVSIDQLARGYQSRFSMPLDEVAEEFKPTITAGQRNTDILRDAVRVLAGAEPRYERTHVLAGAMREAQDMAHRVYRAAGGNIGKIDHYFPQTHNFRALVRAGPDYWVKFVTDRVDRTRMVNDAGQPLNDTELDELLRAAYATLSTEGRSKAKLPHWADKLAHRPFGERQDLSRVIHFDGGDAFLEYFDEFGGGDLWGNYTETLRKLATDTAVLKTFGPDVDRVAGGLQRYAKQHAEAFDTAPLDAIIRNVMGFDTLGDNNYIDLLNGTRNVISSAYMGSAAIASIPDIATAGLNAMMNDLRIPEMLAGLLKQSEADRRLLTRVAGHIDYATSATASNIRFEEMIGSGLSRRLSEANYRLSGFNAYTNRLRHTFMNEMMIKFGSEADKPLADLTPGFKSFLETYGLDADWDRIRAAGKLDYHGARYLDLDSLEDDNLIARTLGAVYTERDLAILDPDARVRAMMNQGLDPSTAGGQAIRAMGQFKTFPATMILHGILRYTGSTRLATGKRFQYLIGSMVTMTLLGAVAYQLREMAKGRDPMEMDTADFWARAFAQGGAMPLVADLILDGQTRHGRGWGEVLLGPTGGLAADLAALPASVMKDDPMDALGKAVTNMSGYTPGQSIWWARAGIQRAFLDNVNAALDPNYTQRIQARERALRDRTGQDYFWEEGFAPERAPAFGQ